MSDPPWDAILTTDLTLSERQIAALRDEWKHRPGAQAMTDILERLRSKSPYLNGSSAERTMDEAADEIERLRHETTSMALQSLDTEKRLRAQIERLRLTPEQAYLRIVEGWLRDNRGIHFSEGAVDDLCKRIARASQNHDRHR